MFEDKVNGYINSKNRSVNETVSNFNVVIPDSLLSLYDKNEYWALNVNFFSCFNNWYNCMTDFNDEFELIYHNNSGIQTKGYYRSMDTTGDPVPVDQRDVPVNQSSPVRAGTGEPLHRLEPVPVRGSFPPVGRLNK